MDIANIAVAILGLAVSVLVPGVGWLINRSVRHGERLRAVVAGIEKAEENLERHNKWLDEHEKQVAKLETDTATLQSQRSEIFRALEKIDKRLDEIMGMIRNGNS